MPLTLAEAADVWWRRLPDRPQSRSPWLADIWRDDNALARWPVVSLALPVLAAMFGLLAGWSHWSPLTLWEYRIGPRIAVAFVQSAVAFLRFLTILMLATAPRVPS